MAGPVVHTYRAAESGLYVNSYLVEGESGVVVVDTNLLVSDIEALRARLRALKKPLLAILVTHAHPDHFNGVLRLVHDKEVPVYATAGVGRVIGEIADAKRAQWSPVYGAEWPAETYYPNSLLADGAQVQLDELSFTVREVGPAESHADSYLVLTANGTATIAFTGDLAFHGTHPTPPTGIPAPGSPRSMSSAANWPAPARCTPGTVTRPGRACSPTSGVTCCTTASSSGGYPRVNRSCPRRPSPSSAPPCKRSSRTRR
jgi:glyoxylase-like metal-dependent hydrolase (beta-lactamase superfamily II)